MISRIIYEDNHLLVVEKPAMMPTQKDASGSQDLQSFLKGYLKEKYHKPGEVFLGIVHRLDRPAAGLMVFARTSKAAARLSQQVRQGSMEKEYLAVVHGSAGQGQLEDFLLKDEQQNKSAVVAPDTPGAKLAKLTFRTLEEAQGLSLVQVNLITGRAHQIRVQFSSRGLPLFGDVKYGKGEKEGLALYSHRLAFEHPTKKERMEFTNWPTSECFSKFGFIRTKNTK